MCPVELPLSVPFAGETSLDNVGDRQHQDGRNTGAKRKDQMAARYSRSDMISDKHDMKVWMSGVKVFFSFKNIDDLSEVVSR